MSTYYRFFEIKDEPTLAILRNKWAIRRAYLEALEAIKEEVGASSVYHYTRDSSLAGFDFDKEPSRADWKRADAGYLPKLTSKAGKALNARIAALKRPGAWAAALEPIGLHPHCIFDEGRIYSPTVCGTGEVFFASVPWKDVDPAEIAKYMTTRAISKSSQMEHLCWQPPAEWVEVKEWEVKKALDEAKQKATQEAA